MHTNKLLLASMLGAVFFTTALFVQAQGEPLQLTGALNPAEVGTVVPTDAEAASGQVTGVPFGGVVTVMFPCLNGVWYVVVAGFKGGPYIYMPIGTITFALGPPRPGAFILGKADTLMGCVQLHTVLPGLRMQMIGTGPL